MNEQVKEEYQNKNKLLDAYDIYRKLKSRDVKIEDMTKEEKEAWTLVTRDRKFMSVLDSFPQGVEPSLVDILPKYNALLDESKNITEDKTPSQRIKQAEQQAERQLQQDAKVRKLVNINSPTAKLNQIGYANIVLMSIIIIIIVAIICVFIFVK